MSHKEKMIARRVNRMVKEIEVETERKFARVEKMLENKDKDAILSHLDTQDRADLIDKMDKVTTFVNTSKGQGASNKTNPLI